MRETKDADFPWWLVILGVTGLWLGYEVWASAIYSQVMGTLVKGIQVTVAVTLVAYVSACALGLGLAVAGLSRYVVLRQAAGNFRYFETYNMVALLYLVMTIGLSLGLRRIEARLKMHTK